MKMLPPRPACNQKVNADTSQAQAQAQGQGQGQVEDQTSYRIKCLPKWNMLNIMICAVCSLP